MEVTSMRLFNYGYYINIHDQINLIVIDMSKTYLCVPDAFPQPTSRIIVTANKVYNNNYCYSINDKVADMTPT